MAPVHHRMPAILDPEASGQWLHDDSHSPEPRERMLLREWPTLALRNVSNAVNRAGNNGPELVADSSKVIAPRQERLL